MSIHVISLLSFLLREFLFSPALAMVENVEHTFPKLEIGHFR